jgi:formylglycine-generating enzyme required for sulfatase activity
MAANKHFHFAALLTCTLTANMGASLPVPSDMAKIPDGDYRPLFRSVTDLQVIPVRSFLIDRLPVSNAEFLEFLQANPGWQRSRVKRLFADESYLKTWAADLDPGTNAPANAPVTYVSWFAAKAYAHWKGKRLLTVAEWEYVASASPKRPDGDKDPDFKKQVFKWYCTPTQSEPIPRGVNTPNFWGVYDLHGLVWEWVADFNTSMVTGDARSDSGLDRELFCGAGSAGAKDLENFPAFMRYGFRSSLKADYCVHNLGFRCAKDL